MAPKNMAKKSVKKTSRPSKPPKPAKPRAEDDSLKASHRLVRPRPRRRPPPEPTRPVVRVPVAAADDLALDWAADELDSEDLEEAFAAIQGTWLRERLVELGALGTTREAGVISAASIFADLVQVGRHLYESDYFGELVGGELPYQLGPLAENGPTRIVQYCRLALTATGIPSEHGGSPP